MQGSNSPLMRKLVACTEEVLYLRKKQEQEATTEEKERRKQRLKDLEDRVIPALIKRINGL